MSIHNPVGDTYFTILLRTHPGRWGKSSSSQSIGTSRPGSHSGEATSDSNAQAEGSSLRLSTGGVHRLSSLLQTLSEGDNIGYVPGQETAGLVVLYPRPVTPSTTDSLIGPLERTRNTQVPGSIAPVTEQRYTGHSQLIYHIYSFSCPLPPRHSLAQPALSLDAGIQIFLTTHTLTHPPGKVG